MLASQIPAKFPIPWANAASAPYIRTIPTASQIGIQNGAASLTDGFPPDTFVQSSAGGVPPFGQDFNGILNEVTAWIRWATAGGFPTVYDSAFSSSIGGYPQGALLQQVASPQGFWVSSVDNNMSDPDTGGANWINSLVVGGALSGTLPNPSLAVGVAAANVGTLGGSLSGNLPNPSIANSVSLPGSPTTATQAVGDSSTKVATTQFVNRASALTTALGYMEMPNGLLLQWGTSTSTTGSGDIISFSTPFTSHIFSITFSAINASNWPTFGVTVAGWSTYSPTPLAAFELWSAEWKQSSGSWLFAGGLGANWIAIGV